MVTDNYNLLNTNMSITRCEHCDNQYDQDTDVEHEEECGRERLKNVMDDFSNWMDDHKSISWLPKK